MNPMPNVSLPKNNVKNYSAHYKSLEKNMGRHEGAYEAHAIASSQTLPSPTNLIPV
jgi:hypothetical protein